MTILDRIILQNLIPAEGNFIDLTIYKDIKSKVSITQEEIEKYKIRTEEGKIMWEINNDEFNIDFTEAEKGKIKGFLTKLDSESKLTNEHLGLYNLFVK